MTGRRDMRNTTSGLPRSRKRSAAMTDLGHEQLVQEITAKWMAAVRSRDGALGRAYQADHATLISHRTPEALAAIEEARGLAKRVKK